ncbi:unnamed protein product [Victoria cruziana]
MKIRNSRNDVGGTKPAGTRRPRLLLEGNDLS